MDAGPCKSVVDAGAATDHLAAASGLFAAFRPATLTAYSRMFADFLSFLIMVGLWLSQVHHGN